MAVYTEISNKGFEQILENYDIGNFKEAKGIAEGVENTNYLLETDQDKYIFTIYEKRVNTKDLPFFLGLMEHLSEKNIPCPLPIHAKDGEVLQKFNSRTYSIVSFLEGKWPKAIRAENCKEVGKLLAKMHLASEDFSLTRENDMSLASWEEMFKHTKEGANSVKSGMEDELKEALDAIKDNWPKDLPSGVIHGDLFPDNVFFIGDDLSGVLDFYFACNDFFAYEIAIALNAWCFEHGTEFNITKAKALLSGYNSERSLSEEELSALPILAAGASIRFLLSRLYDWINRVDGAMVTPKNPLEYLEKLRFHMQVKNHNEYGL